MVTTAPVRLSRSLQRLAGVAGLLGATVLVVNAAKRAHLVPTSAVTQLLAPLAEVFALALITALYLICEGRIGRLGRLTFAVNYVALAALVGVEFVINLVFSRLSTDQIADLRAGPLGVALTVASILFLLGSVGFAITLASTAIPPRGALALYALGSVPVALRAFVPEQVLDVSLFVLAIGVSWLSAWLVGTRRADG
ncbi:hypothetical protein ACWT_6197 [Actinoplanes sp. SE50]|uniref:hypothetical protein n=1 Tax=unclassified Actinoplanes TaxID=2626549 RepID=UPI00023ECF34|nr:MULTISPECIES: hypothetical protein [unclassified Actinoplanes]AEV87211.1 hypothetical protein ACPL_6329 [Actinoplanes sp. SE50/110]ATO85612.1 hypothetical protein ACWT_6197 [Actinoplanes sp. SE50]SLM03025.1 hypothetical protein ACSP50_6311 [Actinoplanes sp. SE50/110]